MKKILLPVIALLVIALAFQSCKKAKQVKLTRAIKIQGLFTLTGSGNTLGVTSSAAAQLAVDEVNKYFADKGLDYSIGLNVTNTIHSADLATAQFSQAKADGVSFIIGPQSSSELAALKPLVDQSKIIVISQSSTAGSLAIAGDAIFRFCPSDKIEGAASANTIFTDGKKGLVTLSFDDAGNKGLQTSVGDAFLAKGGAVDAVTPFPIGTDYNALVATIKAKVEALTTTYGADKVAVYLASFDEGIEIFKLAANEPSLKAVKWYGGDGVVLSAAFTGNTVAADFAIATSFSAPSLGLPDALKDKWSLVVKSIHDKTQLNADAFALAAYDAVWAIAYTIEANNGDVSDFAKLKASFVEQANSHQGISGSDALDEAGDRASGVFDYFGITKTDGKYVWEKLD
nr:ABC transporter substrate-binding protein [Mucilaginibacter sp. L294]